MSKIGHGMMVRGCVCDSNDESQGLFSVDEITRWCFGSSESVRASDRSETETKKEGTVEELTSE